jgi:hypothetical protein
MPSTVCPEIVLIARLKSWRALALALKKEPDSLLQFGDCPPYEKGENTMKKLIFALVLVALLAIPSVAMAQDPGTCTTIQDGTLYGSDGFLLTVGYNEWGYNYQAYLFNGMYCDYHPYYRPGGGGYAWCQANYGDVKLIMKWNDAWLSNKDCDGDGNLDRHYGFDSYRGSGAWLTNQMSGGQGKDHWTYFTKIVAAPADATPVGGMWYTADGTEIGPVIWGAFATVQEVESGSGVTYLSPAGPGVGNW